MKKVILMLVATMLVLAACSSGKNNNDASPSNSPGSAAPSASPSSSSKEKRTITFLLNHADAPYARALSQSGKVNDDMYVKKLSELSGYNLKFDFLNNSDYSTQLSLRFASGDLADMVRTGGINSNDHKGAVESGQFLELNELIDQYAPHLKESIPEITWKSPRVSKDGKIYGIPVLTGTVSKNDRIGAFIRQDWLDKLKMPLPDTIDDWLAFYEAVKKEDMNGNGNPDDEFGTAMFENIAYSGFFFGSFGVDPGAWHLVDGQLVPDMIRPEMREAVEFYRTLYDKGYINRDIFTKKGTDWDADIRNGKVATLAGHVYQYASTYSPAAVPQLFANQPNEARFTMVPPPKGPRGEQYAGVEGDGIYFVWVIPKGTKNPEDLLKYLDWAWGSEDANNFFAYGIEGHNYTMEDGKVKYDMNNPANLDNNASDMFRLSLNPKEIGLNNELAVATLDDAEAILAGYKMSDRIMMKNDGLYMPALPTLQKSPELNPWGQLFYDMFAKIMTGKEKIESFDKFVEDWKKRGGNDVIKEATEWYNDFHK